jgi:galactose mutarotase-like enzyme
MQQKQIFLTGGKIYNIRIARDYLWKKRPPLVLSSRPPSSRVKNGRFLLAGVEHQLTRNDAGTEYRHHVHGGDLSFDRLSWNTEVVEQGVVFSLLSPDGSEVFIEFRGGKNIF